MEKKANFSRFKLGAQQLAQPGADPDCERDRRIFERFREDFKQPLRKRVCPAAAARGFMEGAARRWRWFP
jgi:hypothetical protein